MYEEIHGQGNGFLLVMELIWVFIKEKKLTETILILSVITWWVFEVKGKICPLSCVVFCLEASKT